MSFDPTYPHRLDPLPPKQAIANADFGDLLIQARGHGSCDGQDAFADNRGQGEDVMNGCLHGYSPPSVQRHFLINSRRRTPSAGRLSGRPRPSKTTPSAPPLTGNVPP